MGCWEVSCWQPATRLTTIAATAHRHLGLEGVILAMPSGVIDSISSTADLGSQFCRRHDQVAVVLIGIVKTGHAHLQLI